MSATPAWFDRAVAAAPEVSTVALGDKRIELLVWGDAGRPGLLMLHGSMANAWWWAVIAPLLADRFRVAALSFSGMGASAHHPPYTVAGYADEAIAAARAAGLFASGVAPVVVGHSAGGGVAVQLATREGPERFGAAIIVDSAILPGGVEFGEPPGKPARVYATVAEAVARYRLVPAQAIVHPFLVEWVAAKSLRRVSGGWTWSFDPALRGTFSARAAWDLLPRIQCPLHVVNGAQSSVTTPERMALILAQAPAGTQVIEIAEAAHHVPIDQPLALAEAIGAIADEIVRSEGLAQGETRS